MLSGLKSMSDLGGGGGEPASVFFGNWAWVGLNGGVKRREHVGLARPLQVLTSQ